VRVLRNGRLVAVLYDTALLPWLLDGPTILHKYRELALVLQKAHGRVRDDGTCRDCSQPAPCITASHITGYLRGNN
jgi:hypothetical protein